MAFSCYGLILLEFFFVLEHACLFWEPVAAENLIVVDSVQLGLDLEDFFVGQREPEPIHFSVAQLQRWEAHGFGGVIDGHMLES